MTSKDSRQDARQRYVDERLYAGCVQVRLWVHANDRDALAAQANRSVKRALKAAKSAKPEPTRPLAFPQERISEPLPPTAAPVPRQVIHAPVQQTATPVMPAPPASRPPSPLDLLRRPDTPRI